MKKIHQSGFSAVFIVSTVIVLAGIGGAGYYVIQKNNTKPSDQKTEQRDQPLANEEQAIQDDGWSEPINSGKKGFSITFPDNWGKIIKVLDSDWFLIPGQEQPEGKLIIEPIDSYGSDSSSVFSVLLGQDKNFAPPEGSAEDFILVNGKESSIEGKKYTKTYERDEKVGIGIQRFKGDRDYEYVFKLNDGRELRVFYSVYGSDPSNKLVTVEAIIDSIRLK